MLNDLDGKLVVPLKPEAGPLEPEAAPPAGGHSTRLLMGHAILAVTEDFEEAAEGVFATNRRNPKVEVLKLQINALIDICKAGDVEAMRVAISELRLQHPPGASPRYAFLHA